MMEIPSGPAIRERNIKSYSCMNLSDSSIYQDSSVSTTFRREVPRHGSIVGAKQGPRFVANQCAETYVQNA